MAADEPKPPVRRSLPRRIVRIALRVLMWTALGILGLLGIAWGVLLIMFPDDRIRRLMIAKIEGQTGLQVEAGELELHILRGLVLRDVALRAPPGFSERPVSIERVEVEYSLGQLLDRQFVVKQIHLVHPRLVLEEREGVTNLEALLALRKPPVAKTPPAPETEEDSEPFRVDLRSLVIDGLEVVVARGATRLHLVDGEIRLSGSFQDGKPSARAEISLPCPQDANLVLEDLPAEFPGGRLSLSAGLGLEVGLSAQGELRALGALDLCQPVFPHGAPLRLSFDVAMSEGGRRLTLSRLLLESLVPGAPRALLEASGELVDSGDGLRYSVRAGRVLLSELLGEAVKGALVRGEVILTEAQASGRLDGGLPQANFKLNIGDLHLVRGAVVQGATGVLEGNLDPSQSGGKFSMNARIRAVRAEVPEMVAAAPWLELDLSGRLAFAAEGGVSVVPDPVKIRFGAAQLSGRVAAERVSQTLEMDGSGQAVEIAGGRVILPRLAVSWSAKARRVFLPEGDFQSPFMEAKFALPGGPPGLASFSELLDGRLRAGAASVRLAAATVRDVSLNAELSGGGLGPASLRRPLRGRLDVRLSDAALEGEGKEIVRLGGMRLAGRADVPSLSPPTVAFEMQGGLDRLGLALADGVWQPEKIAWEARGRLSDEQLALDAFRLEVPALAALVASGRMRWADGDTDAKFHVAAVRAEKLAAALPPAWTAGLPPVRGEVELDGAFAGPLAAASLAPAGPWPAARLEVWLRGMETALARPALEVRGLSGRILARWDGNRHAQELNVNLTLEDLRAPGMELAGLSLALTGSGAGLDEMGLQGTVKATRAEMLDLRPLSFSKLALGFDARLLGRKEVWIKELSLDVPSLGSRLEAAGQLVWPGSWKMLSALRASGSVRYTFDSSEPVHFGEKLAVRGKASLEAAVESRPEGAAELAGKLSFDGADVEAGALSISQMRGTLPVRQRILFFPAFELLAPTAAPASSSVDRPSPGASRAYDEALRPLRGEERRFSIGRVQAGSLAFSQVSGALAVEDGRLSLDRLAFGFLGGDVLARMQVVYAPAERRSFSLEGEMSGVDLSNLGGLGTGASEVAGTVRLGANLRSREIGASFHLTQIGTATLDALLRALDPAQANPGISRLQKFLDRFKVAPRSALLELAMGRLSMEVRFDMGFAARAASGLIEGFAGDTYRLPPLPVSGLVEKLLPL